MPDQTLSNLTSAALIVYVQRYFKHMEWYRAFVHAVPGADKWAHRLFAGFGSLVAAIGITITFQGTFDTGWTFQGTIPDGWTVITGVYNFISVFALQQLGYDAASGKIHDAHLYQNNKVNIQIPNEIKHN